MSPNTLLSLAAAAVLLAAAGCSRNYDSDPGAAVPESAKKGAPRPASQASAADPQAPAPGEVFTAPGIAFRPPREWTAQPASGQFRLAQYSLPPAHGDAEGAEMVAFYFQGQGGGVEANIQRWIGQFDLPEGVSSEQAAKIENESFNQIPLTLLDISGTYNKSVGPPMLGRKQPMPGYRMLAAVAETSAGPYFFRLTGPQATVSKWETSFQEFLRSIRPNP